MSQDVSVVDLRALEELSTLLEDEFIALLEAYQQDSLRHIIEMKDAYASGDAPKVRAHAHSLKGSSANLYAAQLASACEQLEHDAQQGDLQSAERQIEEIEKLLHAALDVFKRNGWLS